MKAEQRERRNEAIRRERKRGVPTAVIAEKYEVTQKQVQRILRASRITRTTKKKITERNAEIRLDRLRGLSIEFLAKKYDLSESTIRKVIRKRRMRVVTVLVKQGKITKVR